MIVYYSMPKMFGGDTQQAKEYDRVRKYQAPNFALVEVYGKTLRRTASGQGYV